jgi:DNA-directed RNA polymerase subunit M
MMFCPKCGSLLKPKLDKKRKVLACTCGYSTKDVESAKINEKIAKEEPQKGTTIKVVDEKFGLPETDAKCPECGCERAQYWTIQTRAGDEPETKFLKCKKCGHTWRDYD